MGLTPILLLSAFIICLAHYVKNNKPRHNLIVGDHAIVIGSGIGGLVHAKVLSKRFKKVTIFERDEIPKTYEARRGTPQAAQYHTLLQKGADILTELFPNLESRLSKNGINRSEVYKKFVYQTTRGLLTPFHESFGLRTYCCTRQKMEFFLREELLASSPNIVLTDNTTVQDLIVDGNTVKGVVILNRQNQEQEEFFSDLVVDCSGATSKQNASKFLAERGLELQIEEVDAQIGYTSALYKFEQGEPYVTLKNGKKEAVSLFVNSPSASTEHNAGFSLAPVEGGLYHILWCGYSKNYPPTNEENLGSFISSMTGASMVNEVLQQGKRVTELLAHRGSKCRRVRIDKAVNFPDGLIITADALACFTPLYAQGMTFACMCAKALEATLACQTPYHLQGIGRDFAHNSHKAVDSCWSGAIAQDFKNPDVKANIPPPKGLAFMGAYMDLLLQRLVEKHERELFQIFVGVISMVRSPFALFGPSVLIPVIRMYIEVRGRKEEKSA